MDHQDIASALIPIVIETSGRGERAYDIYSRLLKDRIVFIGTEIDDFVAAALESDPELWDFAFRNKVLLATPTNLIAIARTVAAVWRQEKMAGQAREMAMGRGG